MSSHPLSVSKPNTHGSITPLSITFCVHSVVVASLWLIFRFDDGEITQQVIGMVCYAIAFFGSVAFFYEQYSSIWVLPVHIILLMLIPNILAFVPTLAFGILLGFGLFGLVTLMFSLIKNRHFPIWGYCLATVLGFCSGTWHFLFLQANGAANLFTDIGIYVDFIDGDTLFHSSIVKMLQNFNVPSTGLDGNPPLFYHIGIHRWIASNLHFLIGTPMTLLSSARDILWVPMFLFSLSLSILTASKSIHWLRALLFAFLGNFIYCVIDWPSHLLSESHLSSLPIFISFMPIGLLWLEAYYFRGENLPKNNNSLFIQIFYTGLAIILCSLAKMSTGLIMSCYLICCLLIPRFWDNPKYWLRLIIPSAILVTFVLFLVKIFLLPKYTFKLLAFYRTFPEIAINQLLSFIMCLLICYIFFQDKTKLRKSILLLMVIIFLVGQAPGLLFDIAGGSAWYFSNPTTWVSYFLASILVLARIKGFVLAVSLYPYPYNISVNSLSINLSSSGLTTLNPSYLRILGLALFVLVTFSVLAHQLNGFRANVLFPINTHIKQALSTENSPLSLDVSPENKGSVLDQFSRFKQRLVLVKLALMKDTQLGRIQSIANQLGNDRKNTVIYVPPDAAFWEEENREHKVTYPYRSACWAKPFKVTALTGMPMLNGVRSGVGECPVTEYYGMKSYTQEALNRKLELKELCRRANKLGFSNVLEISTDGYQLHSCNLG